MDALAGRHVVAVHDRLQVAEPRHLVENDEQVALEGAAGGNGVGDPEADPAPHVVEQLLGRDDEEVRVAGGDVDRIEGRGSGAGRELVMKASWLVIVVKFGPALLLADARLALDGEMREAAAEAVGGRDAVANSSCSFASFERSSWRKARLRLRGGSRKRIQAMYPAISERALSWKCREFAWALPPGGVSSASSGTLMSRTARASSSRMKWVVAGGLRVRQMDRAAEPLRVLRRHPEGIEEDDAPTPFPSHRPNGSTTARGRQTTGSKMGCIFFMA